MDKIKVLGNDYLLRKGEHENEGLLGCIDYTSREIFYKHDAAEDSQILTICHEAAHAYLYHTGLQEPMKKGKREKWAQFISMCMVDFITNNPEIVEFMVDENKGRNEADLTMKLPVEY